MFGNKHKKKLEELEKINRSKDQELKEQSSMITELKQKLQELTAEADKSSLKNKKIWKMNETVYKEKKKVDEENEKLAKEKEKLESERQKIKEKNKKLWNQSIAIHKEKERVEEIKKIIEIKHQEVTDSIHYAKRIQQAILTSDEYWNTISKENFVYFLPKDVVSGDFYWAYHSEETNTSIWAAADCTGHGVPGAFMSMIGNAFLNEIVIENKVEEPDKILNKMREKILQSLGGHEGQKDGMDIALCAWNKNENKITFSGANNPIYILNEDSFEEVKGDKQPVGLHSIMNPFTLHEINAKKGDTIVIFSDGYADQFGGERGKKYKYKTFKQFLQKNITLSMKEQHDALNQEFLRWKGSLEQIDDVVVVGIKIT